jgi:hypothetical protein
MSDTPQPFGWAYRNVGDQDISPNWFLTLNEDWINRRAASGKYVIKPVYTAPPSAPDPAPVKESVTVPPVRTLREEAAMQLTARVMGEKVSGKAFSQWLAQAKIEDITDLCVEAADALVKSLRAMEQQMFSEDGR